MNAHYCRSPHHGTVAPRRLQQYDAQQTAHYRILRSHEIQILPTIGCLMATVFMQESRQCNEVATTIYQLTRRKVAKTTQFRCASFPPIMATINVFCAASSCTRPVQRWTKATAMLQQLRPSSGYVSQGSSRTPTSLLVIHSFSLSSSSSVVKFFDLLQRPNLRV